MILGIPGCIIKFYFDYLKKQTHEINIKMGQQQSQDDEEKQIDSNEPLKCTTIRDQLDNWISDPDAVDCFINNIQHNPAIIRLGYTNHDECKSEYCGILRDRKIRDIAIVTADDAYHGCALNDGSNASWFNRGQPVECGYQWFDV